MAQLFSRLSEQQARQATEAASRSAVGAPEMESSELPRWKLTPLEGVSHALAGGAKLLRSEDESGREQWVVVHPPGLSLRVNGVAIGTGIRVLAHQDELRLSEEGIQLYFSSEELPSVVAYDGVDGARCPRCQLPIEHGDPVVRCPQCGVWHHQAAQKELLCWTYSPRCALCSRATCLEGELEWVPEQVANSG